MTFDIQKQVYGREFIQFVEIDFESCSLTHGTPPCTATETGDDKCFNSFETCNDIPNYDADIKTFRFCESRSPHPLGVEAIPNVMSVSIAPTEIDLSGGLGVRSSVSITFNDHPFADAMFDADEYLSDRTYIAFERGTFWTKIRARYPNYQFRNLRLLSGYLVDGIYDAANFETRYYVIETMNATKGRCTITAKDPLRLAMPKKSLCPAPSTGLLNAALTAGATSFTVTPSGAGTQYSSVSPNNYISINNEVMIVTNVATDTLTVTRGQYNTTAAAHGQNDTVQNAFYRNDQVNIIVKNILEDFAGVDASYIPDAAWQSEVDTFLSGLLDGMVTKPTDVNILLKELSQDMPHYLSWDERFQEIKLTALKAPPETANVIDMDEELIAGSVTVKDDPNKRVSTVFVHFGKFDPTKQVTEKNNYQQTYVRIDSDSIVEYGNNQTKTIFSRWISNSNKAAATQLAKLIGRRFSDTPRMIDFSLDAKDAGLTGFWAGQNAMVNHRDMVDATGSPIDTLFQLLSTKANRDTYMYKALEFKYGPTFGDDPPDGEVVYIPTGTEQNMRTLFDALFPTPDASTDAVFIIESGVIAGSTTTSASLSTGSWPAGATITLQLDSGGYLVGKGGDGAGTSSGAATDGGLGLILNHDLTLINNGIVAGGGSGAGRSSSTSSGSTANAAGGGGAGSNVGIAGALTSYSGPSELPPIINQAVNGTLETGGTGGRSIGNVVAIGGNGGDLGQAGTNGNTTNAGAAGDAIDKNGYTLTQTVAGDIRGSIVP